MVKSISSVIISIDLIIQNHISVLWDSWLHTFIYQGGRKYSTFNCLLNKTPVLLNSKLRIVKTFN